MLVASISELKPSVHVLITPFTYVTVIIKSSVAVAFATAVTFAVPFLPVHTNVIVPLFEPFLELV